MITLVAALLSPAARAADCPAAVYTGDLELTWSRMADAFARGEPDALRGQAASMWAKLPCLAEPLRPSAAARLHGAVALEAFDARHDDPWMLDQLSGAIQSALTLDDRFDFPAAMADAVADARAVPLPDWPPEALDPGARVKVDGVEMTSVPLNRPVVLQHLDGDGGARSTRYLRVGDPFPRELLPRSAATTGPVSAVGATIEAEHLAVERRRRVALTASTGAAAAGAVALFGLAAARQAAFLDPATPYGDLDPLARTADALSWGGLGLGLGAAGLGVVTAVTW
jgi:hypothetical protein